METVFIIVLAILLGSILGCLIWVIVAIKDMEFDVAFIPEWGNTILINERKLADMEDKRYEELNDRLTRIDNYLRLLQAEYECERK